MANNPTLFENAQNFLFASDEEMKEKGLTKPMRERMIRIRDMYTYWLNFPRTGDKEIVQELKTRYHIENSTAYEDLRAIKMALGALNQHTKDYDRYLFRKRAEEAFALARKNNDANAYAKVLAAYGKFTKLDKDDLTTPDWAQIQVQPFEPTDDPRVIGIEPIPNVREKIKKYLSEKIEDNIDSIALEDADFIPMQQCDTSTE